MTVHWSVFGGYANSVRTEPYYEKVNNWTVLFDAKKSDLKKAKDATLTVSQQFESETCESSELTVTGRSNWQVQRQLPVIPTTGTQLSCGIICL